MSTRPIGSVFPDIDIPNIDLLTYLFPPSSTPSTRPIWINSRSPTDSLSPRQLVEWVKRFGHFLSSTGIPPGSVVTVHTPNHIFVPVIYLAVVGSGRIFSGLSPTGTVSEVEFQLRDTGAELVLAHPDVVDVTLSAARAVGLSTDRILLFAGTPISSEILKSTGLTDWRDLLPSVDQSSRFEWARLGDRHGTPQSTVATINYSSGTTGLPKGVAITHRNLISNVEQHVAIRYARTKWTAHSRPDERWIGALPLYHAYGQLWTVLMAIKLDIPVYILDKFRFTDFLNIIQKFRITHLQTVPPVLVMLAKREEVNKYDLSSLTDCLCGSAPLSKSLQHHIRTTFKIDVRQGWGMTELTCGAMHVPGGTTDESGSVGQLDPNMSARLIDSAGLDVPDGTPGELLVRGPNVCIGYWNNPTATSTTITSDGWLKTGDIAIHKSGWFWIVDRIKELIKVNGFQVAPAELEAVLLQHPSISDCACVGISIQDEEWPRAYIVRKSVDPVTEQSIKEWVATRTAKYKHLVGGVVFVDRIPKLASGKIVRRTIREWAKRDGKVLEKTGFRARM